MPGYKKWIFGTLGFALTGTPIGAVIGFALGALLDNAEGVVVAAPGGERRRFQPGNERRTATPGDLAVSLVILTAAVMKADGKATHGELGHVRRFFVHQFGPQHSAELLRLLRDVLKREIPLRDVCLQIRSHLSHPERLQVMHYLIGLANADGMARMAERKVLERIAADLGISEKDLASLDAMFRGPSVDSAYTVLEADPKASDEELKKAYRRMAMKHHPDRVANLGEEVQKAAAEKFRRVQEAWERVAAERGIK
ncbi:MAG TPA: TerB family tellurite resistance protein [Flavobacteriales bacterium]|nr:TerB family tellurite resistance protein [Flavobacteriales bacterium]HRO39205.1 TerB family tellurite resistance protein [Flavobacteriales bacterium]HRP81712.1 TerB family tellurite resistance protein [Flavobacteriales bacterium]